MSNFKYSLMDNRNDSNKAIIVLLGLFLAIILRDATTGTLSSTWVTLMGAIIIGLFLSAMLVHHRKGGDILHDR